MPIEKIAVNCICETRSSLQFPLCFWIFTIINLNCYFFYLSLWGKLWSLFKIVFSMKDLFFQFSTYSLLGILFDFFSSSFYIFAKISKNHLSLQNFIFLWLFFWQLKILDIWFWKNILQLCSTQMYAQKYWNQYLNTMKVLIIPRYVSAVSVRTDYWLRWGEDLTSLLTSLFLRGLRWGSSISFDARNEVRSSIFLWGWGKKSFLTLPQFKHEKCWKS